MNHFVYKITVNETFANNQSVPAISTNLNENLSQARSYFNDELSLALFDTYADATRSNRIFTEMEYATELAQLSLRLKEGFNNLKKCIKPYKFFMFGGGGHCKEILENFTDLYTMSILFQKFQGELDFEGIIDNNISDNTRYNLPILTYEDFKQRHSQTNSIVFISIYDYEAAAKINDMISGDGYTCFTHRELCDISRAAYFDFFSENKLLYENEVFVQAGCADGWTQKCYIDYVGDNYKKIITFEPSSDFEKCQKSLKGIRDCVVVQAGVGDKTENLGFVNNPENMQGSHFSGSSKNSVRIVALDDFCKYDSVTFIALDVEGFELRALQGSSNIITTLKPKLAISVYHKPEDIYEIPIYIKQLNPNYKLALRLYGKFMDDCICYAY